MDLFSLPRNSNSPSHSLGKFLTFDANWISYSSLDRVGISLVGYLIVDLPMFIDVTN